MVEIKRLYDLQELDWSLATSETSLGEVRALLADDSTIVTAKGQLEQLESQSDGLGSKRRDDEFTVNQLEERLKDIQGRLYGGSITSPRGLTAYEEERKNVQSQLGVEQDKLLELMVQIDDLNSVRHQARENLERLEAERGVQIADLGAEEKRLIGEADELRRLRDETVPEFPVRTLTVYESLLKSRGGHAVARVERGMCQACRISLPSGDLQKAKSNQDVVQCSSCRRILYVV